MQLLYQSTIIHSIRQFVNPRFIPLQSETHFNKNKIFLPA
ncbi:hypothetical protein CLOBOL_06108 [Enterocloster bolteae ATCC BAA-613]|uniref:Uncharacterized protein n=1 Tax=Enterocloster bolteae (strain ATCC BAA-613 / DSM 15670 / CCUG 46953 / JCM 12243 / WAL 16351) TaxID=411902 RepID=A8S1N2_ENTBW|nr:hypothetical protein CLOBOL_06108 [Enterocloster bolteae ATCC BAA-613]